MTVYVDNMHESTLGHFKTRSGRTYKMSHMIADSDEELHAMADKIGVDRRWFQKPGTPGRHYDITKTKRAEAIAAGAVEITMQQAALMCAHRRVTGQLCTPEEADAMRAARGRPAP